MLYSISYNPNSQWEKKYPDIKKPLGLYHRPLDNEAGGHTSRA